MRRGPPPGFARSRKNEVATTPKSAPSNLKVLPRGRRSSLEEKLGRNRYRRLKTSIGGGRFAEIEVLPTRYRLPNPAPLAGAQFQAEESPAKLRTIQVPMPGGQSTMRQ